MMPCRLRFAILPVILLIACGGKPAPTSTAQINETWIVENFENDSPMAGEWRLAADDHGLGTAVEPFRRQADGSPISPAGSALIRGRLGRHQAPWSWVHFNVFLDRNFAAVDMSRFRSVEFYARGDGKTYAVMLHRQSVKDGDDFHHLFTAPAAWTRIRIPISAFAQAGWGTPVQASYGDVTAIRFGVVANDEDFRLQVDDIVFSTQSVEQAVASGAPTAMPPPVVTPDTGRSESGARIILLHHSTGGVVYEGGLPEWFAGHNKTHGTHHVISERAYPNAPYPWHNYPYDYWNLWVNHAGSGSYQGQDTLERLTGAYDVIVWKHCFPVSDIQPNTGSPDVSSEAKTIENYQVQYEALKKAMRRFPGARFIVWTGAAQTKSNTNESAARRAREFSVWVKEKWDEAGDNIFVWDFRQLETEGGLYLLDQYAAKPVDSHPGSAFARKIVPLLGRRIVAVIEGRGDSASLTGE